MKILHFILGKANKSRANGVNQVVAGLAKYCASRGVSTRVIGKAESVEREGEVISRDGFSVEAYSVWGKPLLHALTEAISWADVVHLHGVYSPWNLMVARMCDKARTPYVVTLHDGLASGRSHARGKYKKWLFHTFLQRRHLANAAGVHVLTEEEATDLYSVAQPKNIFCIPNGVDLDDYPCLGERKYVESREVTIGYLGRLSVEKNLEALCVAFSLLNRSHKMRLMLAGPPSAYGKSLLNRFAEHGVIGVGAKFGIEKSEFISSLDLFVHPSLCDVFSIAGMEVMALGTPLLITRTSKASYFYDRRAFFMSEPTVFGLERGLRNALEHRADWPIMVANGRRLIVERLNWRAAADDMLAAYYGIVVKHV